jgi:hypothetical protein
VCRSRAAAPSALPHRSVDRTTGGGTQADRDAEAAILDILRRVFPEHATLAEESGAEGAGRDRWIVDPLDGTRGFARGGTFWGPLVAYERDGRVLAGAMALPALRETYWAGRGMGAGATGNGCGSPRSPLGGCDAQPREVRGPRALAASALVTAPRPAATAISPAAMLLREADAGSRRGAPVGLGRSRSSSGGRGATRPRGNDCPSGHASRRTAAARARARDLQA